MSITATERSVRQTSAASPPEWEAFVERGSAVLADLPVANRALEKRRAGKLVECDLEGKNLINTHRYHTEFMNLVNAMVGHSALQQDRERAAAYLLKHYLVVAMKTK